MAIYQPAASWVPPPPPTQNNTTLPPPGTSLNANGSLHHLAPLSAPGPGWVDPRITAMQQQQATNAAYMANVAKQSPGMSATTATPTGTNTVDNTTVANNPFSVQQFQQMYAQNPAMALKMYMADQAAGGRSAINTAMNWGNQAIGTSPGAAAFIQKYSAGGTGYQPGLSLNGLSGQFAPAAGSYIANYLSGQPATNQPATNMSNLNSNVGTNGPYGAGYTGFGNSVMAGPSPTGPTNLPTGPGVNPNTASTSASTNGTNNTHVAGGTGPSTPLVPNGGTPGIAPAPAAPAGPDGGGAPSIGPAPTPNISPTPTSGNAGGGYAGTNISNSNYNNRFGMNLV